MADRYGSLEAGGTKFVCATGTGPGHIEHEKRIPTTTPSATLAGVIDFFTESGPLAAVGIASFGPVELRRSSPAYGSITQTPKPGWSGTDLVGPIAGALNVPAGFDTDVNGAALGEGRWGAAQDLETFVYMTVGTGVGAGAVIGGRVAHGMVHAEMGHISVVRRPGDDFAGICPFHGDCLEGMASGPAIAARWGTAADQLTGAAATEAIQTEAFYLAQGLRNVVYTIAPERIVVGGGVAKMDGLLAAVRTELNAALAGYPGLEEHSQPEFVVPPGLGDGAGIAGGFVLAELAARE